MGSATTVVFYGVRLDVTEAEVESLEARAHPVITKARAAGLQCYWGNFGAPEELYYLLIGALLGKFGVEDAQELRVTPERLSQLAADTAKQLTEAGFSDPPALLIQFQPDD